MKSAPFHYHRAGSVDEVLDLLDEFGEDAKVLAGGQSLLPMMSLRLARPPHLVDIGSVTGLRRLEVDTDGWLYVGAGVRHVDIERSDLVREVVPLLARSMPYIGHAAIRSRGTVCGSLVHADGAAELPAVAVASGAECLLRTRGSSRTVAAKDFFVGTFQSVLADGELLEAVRFPPAPPRSGSAIHELSRRSGDFAMVGAAGTVTLDEAGRIDDAAIAYFGVAGTPTRIDAVEDLLRGRQPGDQLYTEASSMVADRLDPEADIHASSAYRRHGAGVLTRRVLADACAEASEGEG